MNRKSLRKYVEKVIRERSTIIDADKKVQFFNQLWESNIVDQERVLKGAINHYYDKEFKKSMGNTREAVFDAAIYFDVSVSTVKNTIYKFKHVVLNL